MVHVSLRRPQPLFHSTWANASTGYFHVRVCTDHQHGHGGWDKLVSNSFPRLTSLLPQTETRNPSCAICMSYTFQLLNWNTTPYMTLESSIKSSPLSFTVVPGSPEMPGWPGAATVAPQGFCADPSAGTALGLGPASSIFSPGSRDPGWLSSNQRPRFLPIPNHLNQREPCPMSRSQLCYRGRESVNSKLAFPHLFPGNVIHVHTCSATQLMFASNICIFCIQCQRSYDHLSPLTDGEHHF